MTTSISNLDDTIDSRDVITRIEELREERATLEEADTQIAIHKWDEGTEGLELKALESLAEDAEGYSDWTHGAQLIRESYFEAYARELADDVGAVDRDAKWPMNCIDWEQAARELQMDYTSVEFDGVTYYVR